MRFPTLRLNDQTQVASIEVPYEFIVNFTEEEVRRAINEHIETMFTASPDPNSRYVK